MTTDLLPPHRHTFRAGEAVLYIPSTQREGQPLSPIPAVVVRERSRIRKLTSGQVSTVHPSTLVYRGYCPTCPAPAIIGADGQLVCGQCGAPAIDLPPPDALVLRWFPLGLATPFLAAHRALTHPDWTWSQASKDAQALGEAIYNGVEEAQRRLGLPLLTCRYTRRGFETDRPLFSRMELAAFFGDDAAFTAAYEQAQAAQAEPEPNPLIELLRLLRSDGDGPGRPSQRLDLTPLTIDRPLDDSTPDGEDEVTRWLAQQFRRAA